MTSFDFQRPTKMADLNQGSVNILYDEVKYSELTEGKRVIFVYEWLKNLEEALLSSALTKAELKAYQPKIIGQLNKQLESTECGPPTRHLLAKCFAVLYNTGDTFGLFETVTKCCDIIGKKDDSPAFLPVKLAATACLGAIFDKLGRLVCGSFMEIVQTLIKALKNAETQGRCEIMLCLQGILSGLSNAGVSAHKDIYKAVRNSLTDRSMPVRCAAAKCALELINHASFTYTSELESFVNCCFKGLEGSNYDVRVCVAQLLGTLVSLTQQPPSPKDGAKVKRISVAEMLSYLSGGFLRGGIGFLKGGAGAGELLKTSTPREVRVGVTHAYVVLFTELGGKWIEQNVVLVLSHVLELLSSPKATTTHVDAVYSRKCVSFILRMVLGRLLSESAQIEAGKELCKLVTQQMNIVHEEVYGSADGGVSIVNANELSIEVISTQHVLVCALQELGCLVRGLGTSSIPMVTEHVLDPILSVLLHPAPAARLSASWCLRCIAVAVPSQLAPLIDRCANKISSLKSSPEAVSGYAHSIAALVGGVYECPLGIPQSKTKLVYNLAEDLLRSATQNTKLTMKSVQGAWVLLGSLMTLGPSVVKHHLPQMLMLWTNAFPKSVQEIDAEKGKGDPFTWQVTLENRAAALCSMCSFVVHCPSLLSDDIIRRLLVPLESCLTLLPSLTGTVKTHGVHLKASVAMIRLRLYQTLGLLPPRSFESLFSGLLRELVAEFTLGDNPANTTTSLLRAMCHRDDSILLGSWLQETDHKSVEDQLQPNSASGSGALEHDPSTVYARCHKGEVPGPLPLGVSVIDASIQLFGSIFPFVAQKHRSQLLGHFAECIKQSKSSRQQAIQINIFTAFLSALKGLAETKSSFGDDDIRNIANNLVMSALTNADLILRCSAGEALGRIAQVLGDTPYVALMAQTIFETLRTARDAVLRTGHSLALGCLHRYVGGMGSGQHLSKSVGILVALSQDNSSSLVQVWALHALALVADCGGPMFRGYVEGTMGQVIDLQLKVPPAHTEVHQCLGKCLAALITSIGPDLQSTSNSMADIRSACLVACSVMQNHPDSLVQSEAITCLQQLHLFAPQHINLATLVPKLCINLSSPHLLVRRASVACLRQLSQREAMEVCEHAVVTGADGKVETSHTYTSIIPEKGLPGALFAMLDTEVDPRLCSDIHDTLTSMLLTLGPDNLSDWLSLCKDVLTAVKSSPSHGAEKTDEPKGDGGGSDDDDEGGDEAGGMAGNTAAEETHPSVSPRWPTRVFAAESVRRIISVCEQHRAHFDLVLARELRQDTGKGDYLVMHLSEVVRMAFMAATSTCDQLKLEGLRMLQDIVNIFATVSDPDMEGHSILEQFQAQVGAALRPAFTADTPSDVTAMACEVSNAWISHRIARDLTDVRRIQQLLVSSLSKLSSGKDSTSQLYNESASVMEKLAVLKAWAEVYIVAMKQQASPPTPPSDSSDFEKSDSLLSLVEPELRSLSKYWLGALKDHALLSLPAEYASQLPPQGGMFYTPDSMEQCRSHYKSSWPPILHAVALWLNHGGFESAETSADEIELYNQATSIVSPSQVAKTPEQINTDRFHLVMGICVEALCSSRTAHSPDVVNTCLEAMHALLDAPWPRSVIGGDKILAIELLNVLHRLLLTCDTLSVQLIIMEVVKHVAQSAQESIESFKSKPPAAGDVSGIGEEEIIAGKSLVFALMEVCMCVLSRLLSNLVPTAPMSPARRISTTSIGKKGLSDEASKLISMAVTSLASAPLLCSPSGSITVLPVVLHIISSVLHEVSTLNSKQVTKSTEPLKVTSTVTTILRVLQQLASSDYAQNPQCCEQWVKLLQSALATILDMAKANVDNPNVPSLASDDPPPLDSVTTLLAVAIFLLSAPKDVSVVPVLQQQSITVFTRTLKSENPHVQLKCIQSMISVFQHADRAVSTPFIHALVPEVVDMIGKVDNKTLNCESHLYVYKEGIKMMEVLVELTEEDKKVEMLGLLVPILVDLLQDSECLIKANQFVKQLHDYSLQELMKIGPRYPVQFKTIMVQSPELKQRLEAAIKASQVTSKSKSSSNPLPAGQQKQPTIKLKMDFSNFK